MPRGGTKRFYKSVAADRSDGGYRVLLDGRPVKTPSRADMILPTRALAEAVAGEWAAQTGQVDPAAMPLTVLLWTAIDLVRPRRADTIDELAGYAAHDLLCYRAEGPADLAARQQATWQPLLDWATVALDAPLATTAGIVSVAQPEASLAALRRAVAALDDLDLAALAAAAKSTGSLVIGLALHARHIDPQAAFDAAQLEESYQTEVWGEEAEATRCRTAIRQDIEAIGRLMSLLRG